MSSCPSSGVPIEALLSTTHCCLPRLAHRESSLLPSLDATRASCALMAICTGLVRIEGIVCARRENTEVEWYMPWVKGHEFASWDEGKWAK